MNNAIVLGIVLVMFIIFYNYNMYENFTKDREISFINESDAENINNKVIDTKICHPSCCSNQWPRPFDNMTEYELTSYLKESHSPNNFVTTNYTCANGDGGSGCPCINNDSYFLLINRGNNLSNVKHIEPNFYKE